MEDGPQHRRALSSFDPDEGGKPRRGASWGARRKRPHPGRDGAPRKGAFSRLVQLCATRDRSQAELRERLLEDGYDAEQAEEAVQRALDCNLVDDARFADAFVRARVSAGRGLLGIERDLATHDIDPAILEGWPESYALGREDQILRAVAMLDSHPPKAKDTWAAAYRRLISKGYAPAIARVVVRLWRKGAAYAARNDEGGACE
jgi:regulatory protein